MSTAPTLIVQALEYSQLTPEIAAEVFAAEVVRQEKPTAAKRIEQAR